MAATCDVQEAYGAGPTLQIITTGRYCTDDAYSPGSNYPCVIPTAGFYYSYWKHHNLKFSGTYTQVTNVKWYCTGNPSWSLGTAGEVRIGRRDSGVSGCPEGSYVQATGTQGTTGTDLETGHSYFSGQTNKSDPVGNFLTGSRLDIDAGPLSGDPDYSNYAVTQVKIDTDATQGSKGAVTFTFAYDEV